MNKGALCGIDWRLHLCRQGQGIGRIARYAEHGARSLDLHEGHKPFSWDVIEDDVGGGHQKGFEQRVNKIVQWMNNLPGTLHYARQTGNLVRVHVECQCQTLGYISQYDEPSPVVGTEGKLLNLHQSHRRRPPRVSHERNCRR